MIQSSSRQNKYQKSSREEKEEEEEDLMALRKEKDISTTIDQSSSSSNTSYLPSNNKIFDGNGCLQSTNMSADDNQENFSLRIRLKVRVIYFFSFIYFFKQSITDFSEMN